MKKHRQGRVLASPRSSAARRACCFLARGTRESFQLRRETSCSCWVVLPVSTLPLKLTTIYYYILYSILCTLYSILHTLYSILYTLYSILNALYSILYTPYYAIRYNTIRYDTILYSTLLYCTALYYAILYCTILYYNLLYYTIRPTPICHTELRCAEPLTASAPNGLI